MLFGIFGTLVLLGWPFLRPTLCLMFLYWFCLLLLSSFFQLLFLSSLDFNLSLLRLHFTCFLYLLTILFDLMFLCLFFGKGSGRVNWFLFWLLERFYDFGHVLLFLRVVGGGHFLLCLLELLVYYLKLPLLADLLRG